MTAVVAWRATAEERELALPPYESRVIVHGLVRAAASATLMELFNLAIGTDDIRTRPPNQHELHARIGSALERGLLLILPGWELPRSGTAPAARRPAQPTPDDRLAEALMGERRSLPFEGRRYQLVTLRRWREQQRQTSSSTDFRLLLPKEARSVVGRLSESLQVSTGDKSLWKQTLERLFDGSVARRGDDGVVLLCYAPPVQRGAEEATASAPPPSRPRPRIAPTDWIELEIVYEDGTPFDGNCALELPGGRLTTGPADEDGVVRVEGIDPGSCAVSLPDVHPDAWSRQ